MRTVLIIVGVAVAGAVAIIIFKRMNGIGLENLGPPPPLTKDCGSISNFFSGHVGRKNAIAPSVISSYTGASKEQAQGIADIAAKFDVSQYAEKYIGEKIAGWFCGKDFGDILSSIGGGIKDAAVAVGEGVKDAAVAVGEGVKDAAVFVGEGAKDLAVGGAKGVASGAKAAGKAVVTTAKSDTTKAIATGGLSLLFGGKKRPMTEAERIAAAKVTRPGVEQATRSTSTGTRTAHDAAKPLPKPQAPIVYGTSAEQASNAAESAARARAAAEAAAKNPPAITPPKTTTYSPATSFKTAAPSFSTLGRKTF
jgi:hypothetical protein